jgi:hypothetical protein
MGEIDRVVSRRFSCAAENLILPQKDFPKVQHRGQTDIACRATLSAYNRTP